MPNPIRQGNSWPPVVKCLPAILAAAIVGEIAWFVGHLPLVLIGVNVDGFLPHGSFANSSPMQILGSLFGAAMFWLIFFAWIVAVPAAAVVAMAIEASLNTWRLKIHGAFILGVLAMGGFGLFAGFVTSETDPLRMVPILFSGAAMAGSYLLFTRKLRSTAI